MSKKKGSYATVPLSKSYRTGSKPKKRRIYVSESESSEESQTDVVTETRVEESSDAEESCSGCPCCSSREWKYETSDEEETDDEEIDEETDDDREGTLEESEGEEDEDCDCDCEDKTEEIPIGPFGMAARSPRKHKGRGKGMANGNDIFRELTKRQLADVPAHQKLNINDMKRICKYIETSIFDDDKCCVWRGYITNQNNTNKGTYVNFYFRTKKVALHRLLYSNFVAPLDDREYLKFNCDNKGICCNVNHYDKYKYSKTTTPTQKTSKYKKPKRKPRRDPSPSTASGSESDEFIIDFD